MSRAASHAWQRALQEFIAPYRAQREVIGALVCGSYVTGAPSPRSDIDVAIVWGPLAGYFAKRSPVPLKLQPLGDRDSLADLPFRYDIAMAVRRRDRELRDSLDKTLKAHAPEIQAILKEYGIPMFPVAATGDGDDDDGPPKPAATPTPADTSRTARKG